MSKTAMFLFSVLVLVGSVQSATKCERDYTGGICCWDTITEGPYKPINC